MSDVMDAEIVVRHGEVSDLPLLWNMLFEAAAVNAEIRSMGKETAISLPQIRKYAEGWGRDGDVAVVAAVRTGKPLGAAWFRLFAEDDSGYGFVAEDIPEMTIGVIEDARGRGIGSMLMEAILKSAKEEGHRALSLSVESESDAVRLYERYGFKEKGKSRQRGTSKTMLLDF